MRPTLLLDCDGILSDFATAFVALVNDTLGTSHDVSQVTRFSITDSLALSREDAMLCKRRLGATPGFCLGLEPYPGSQEAVKALRHVADLYIVTSPWNSNPTWMHEREQWLREHYDIQHSNVLHTSAKFLVRGDMFVDDKLEAVERWSEHNTGRAVHWQTPHNLDETWGGSATNQWAQLLEWLS